MTSDEKEELEMLRACAARWMTSPLDRGCFELESIIERQQLGPVIRLMIKVILLLRQEIRK